MACGFITHALDVADSAEQSSYTVRMHVAGFVGQNIRGLCTGLQIFYPRMKRPYLPLPAVQAAQPEYINHELTKYCSTTNILTPENYPLYGM